MYIYQKLVLNTLFCPDQISKRVFELMRSECNGDCLVSEGMEILGLDSSKRISWKETNCSIGGAGLEKENVATF